MTFVLIDSFLFIQNESFTYRQRILFSKKMIKFLYV